MVEEIGRTSNVLENALNISYLRGDATTDEPLHVETQADSFCRPQRMKNSLIACYLKGLENPLIARQRLSPVHYDS